MHRAILAAVIFRTFAQARAKARQTVCLSNMKQIGFATQMYLQDYDGQYFDLNLGGIEWTVPRFDPNQAKDYLLRPYLKNVAVLGCPEEHTADFSGQPVRFPHQGTGRRSTIRVLMGSSVTVTYGA